MEPTHDDEPPPDRADSRANVRRWLVALLVLAILAVVLSVALSGGPPSATDARADTFALAPADLAATMGGRQEQYRRTNPPVDVAAIERAARHLPLVDVPLPDSRHVSSYQHADTSAEITQVFLVYDDAARAEAVDALAAAHLAPAFGLTTTPASIEGVEDARLWTAPGYQAVSFRLDGVVVFVGTTDLTSTDATTRLAQVARDHAKIAQATLAASAGTSTSVEPPGR